MKRAIIVCLFLILSANVCYAFSQKYDRHFKRYGEFFFPGYDWRWWKSQAITESGLDPFAVSWCGAMGIMQIMPATAKEIGLKKPFDPELSIYFGIKYDKWIWKFLHKRKVVYDYPEDLCAVFAGYNAGVGRFLKAHKKAGGKRCDNVLQKMPRETQTYVKKIREFFKVLSIN